MEISSKIVKIFKEVTNSMRVIGISTDTLSNINFQPGRTLQILDGLKKIDTSITEKDTKFPLIAMLMPVAEIRGRTGYYASVRIERIIIATLIKSDGSVIEKYNENETFLTILYPIYEELLKRIAWHPETIGQDPNAIVHEKFDSPSRQPIGGGTTDYIDTMEISNLELIINQIKTC